MITLGRMRTKEQTKLPENHCRDTTEFTDSFSERQMSSNRKLGSAVSSSNRTRSQPCSPAISAERVEKLKESAKCSKSLPSSPTISKDIPKHAQNKTNKTIKMTTKSNGIDRQLGQLNDNASQNTATTDLTPPHTQLQSNKDEVLFLASKRTRSRKRVGYFGRRIGSYSAPNSPMMVAGIGVSEKKRRKSRSVPTSPVEQLQNVLQQTRRLQSPDKKEVAGHVPSASDSLGQRENVDSLALFRSLPESTDTTKQDVRQQQSEKEKLKFKRTRSLKRKRSHHRNSCGARSEPNSPLIANPPSSEIEVKEEEASKSLPSSPTEHIRHMFGVLSGAWNKLCRTFSK